MNNPEVEALRKVDALDQKALKLKREIRDLPEDLNRHKAGAKASADRVKRCHEEQKALQREIDKIDLDTRSNQEQMKKFQIQQNTVKTNEEYSALKKQIDALKKANGDLEDRALGHYEKLDALRKEEADLKESLKEAEERLKSEEADIAKEIAVLETELAGVLAERAATEKGVGAQNLVTYRRVLEKHGNRALASVRGRTCQGCFIEIAPNSLSTLLSGKEIVVCKQCARILYLENDYKAVSSISYLVGDKDRGEETSKDGNW